MLPIINIFGKEIGVYAVMALIGALLSGAVVYRRAKKRGLDEIEAVVTMLVASVGMFIGMHMLYALTQIPLIPAIFRGPPPITPLGDAVNIFLAIFGGSVFYGGLIGGLVAASLYLRHKKLSAADYMDLFAPAIPLFHLFGRIGCFFGGCCYGIECPLGFVYTKSLIPSANGVRRFPVQLLEASVLLILFAALFALYKKGRFRGKLLYIYLASYAFCRFFLEFLRGDEYRGVALGVSTSQLISVLLLVFALWKLLKKRKRTEHDSHAVTNEDQ